MHEILRLYAGENAKNCGWPITKVDTMKTQMVPHAPVNGARY